MAWVIKFVLHRNLLKLNKFCLKYETFQERPLVVARQVTMAGLSKKNLTHSRFCIKEICTETIIFVTSMRFPVTEGPKTRGNVVRENNLIQNISWYCWPFFFTVKLLHPLPFKNSRSQKNCDSDIETFGLPIHLWSKKSGQKCCVKEFTGLQSNHLSDAFF